MKKIDSFWMDEFNNKWDCSMFDELQAIEISCVLNQARNLSKNKKAYRGRTNISISEAFFYLNEEEYECDK